MPDRQEMIHESACRASAGNEFRVRASMRASEGSIGSDDIAVGPEATDLFRERIRVSHKSDSSPVKRAPAARI